METLNTEEHILDEHLKIMKMNKQILEKDETYLQYNYITHGDLCKIFPDQTVLMIKTDEADAAMEVPEPMYIFNNSAVKQKYQINLKTDTGQIDVYALNQNGIPREPIDINAELEKLSEETDLIALEEKLMQLIPNADETPIIRLEPAPSSKDYFFAMEKNDDIFDLFKEDSDDDEEDEEDEQDYEETDNVHTEGDKGNVSIQIKTEPLQVMEAIAGKSTIVGALFFDNMETDLE